MESDLNFIFSECNLWNQIVLENGKVNTVKTGCTTRFAFIGSFDLHEIFMKKETIFVSS